MNNNNNNISVGVTLRVLCTLFLDVHAMLLHKLKGLKWKLKLDWGFWDFELSRHRLLCLKSKSGNPTPTRPSSPHNQYTSTNTTISPLLLTLFHTSYLPGAFVPLRALPPAVRLATSVSALVQQYIPSTASAYPTATSYSAQARLLLPTLKSFCIAQAVQIAATILAVPP